NPEDEKVVLHLPRHLPVDQVLLVGPGSGHPEVVDLDVRKQRFEDVAVAVLVADAVACGVRVAEEQDATAAGAPRGLELVVAAEPALVHPDQVSARLVLDARLHARDEAVAEHRVVLVQLTIHRRRITPCPAGAEEERAMIRAWSGTDKSDG